MLTFRRLLRYQPIRTDDGVAIQLDIVWPVGNVIRNVREFVETIVIHV
jgi:hypothetical protein